MMFNHRRPRDAVAAFVGDDDIRHTPHMASGEAGFIASSERMATEYPGKRIVVKRAMDGHADGYADGEVAEAHHPGQIFVCRPDAKAAVESQTVVAE